MRRGLTALLALTGILLTGCGATQDERPQVTFYSHGESVRVSPVRYCEPLAQECSEPRPGAVRHLTVPADSPMQISVSEDVQATPWQVVFRYRTASGEQRQGRSKVFSPEERFAYTLDLSEPGARLEQVEVQRYTAVFVNELESRQFVIGGTWVLKGDRPDPAES
ncbi:outer membrane biogenesis lipoprotein LolB [Actinopolyspora biskrensis]|uniref:Outer membrane biogenesis lipoprotein LolB n=1 Tax=Actinopolyspora biskrensis TaxID=1470178 RepID=A0A852YVH3_9ACTN|nr:outer membrane biogenesis lipoprotein LolB [Actinopolyspora biskrensis]